MWLWVAVLGPILLFALQRYSAVMRRRNLAAVAAPEFLTRLTSSRSRARRTLKDVLLLLAVAGMGLALARPQWGERQDAMHLLGRDVLFLLDCSRSMLAIDVTPSRLKRAKIAILEQVHSQARGRVGLIAFSGQAFLQCPLTFDYNAFEEALAAIDDRTIPVQGTDLGRAIDEAFRALERTGRKKVLVLLTDGEDLEKGGIPAAQEVAKHGITIFTIAVGTRAGSEIYHVTEQGRNEVLRDRQGEIVHSRLDEVTLKEIARITGGTYFPLGPLGEGLVRVRRAIETLPPDSGAAPARKLGVDRFHWPLAGVIVLLVGESLIGTRRRVTRVQQVT
jgi:Ca-activated chloride channel family protein